MGRPFVVVLIDALEPRLLFAAAPVAAAGDAYATDEDRPLVVESGVTSLTMLNFGPYWIGQGNPPDPTYTRADGVFSGWSSNYDDPRHGTTVSFFGFDRPGTDLADWRIEFTAPGGRDVPLTPGAYADTTGYGEETDASAEFDIGGNGHARAFIGTFTVLQYEVDADGRMTRFAGDFAEGAPVDPAERVTVKVRYRYAPPGSKSGVLANDTGGVGSPLAARVVAAPKHGELTLDDDGSFRYVPAAGFAGVDRFTYVATDGVRDSVPATVKITVNPVNDAPRFRPGPNPSVPEDSGAHAVVGWARKVTAGGPGESGRQSLRFAVTSNTHPNLFARGSTRPPARSPTSSSATRSASRGSASASPTTAAPPAAASTPPPNASSP